MCGGWLQKVLQVWLTQGSNPRATTYLRKSWEALHSLIDKQAVEMVMVRSYLTFHNSLFLVQNPNNRWRLVLDISTMSLYFMKEASDAISESTTLSLQGEWVTSLDVIDTYFQIPIKPRSKKYPRFHLNGQTCQFKYVPFCLATGVQKGCD